MRVSINTRTFADRLALVAVHRAGVIHRDVKPANILLSSRDRVVLVDFGVMLPEISLDESAQRWAAGTAEYMAPEAIRGETARGEGCLLDLYALGITAYEIVTGSVPFERDSITEIVRAQLSEDVPILRLEKLGGVPETFVRLVASLTMKDPLDRPPTAQAVVEELRAIERAENYETVASTSVLIIDDDPAARDLVTLYARRHLRGACVHVASDGVEALEVAERTRPHIIFMDLRLPRMNGVEVCMHLRGMPHTKHATIVVVSGEDDACERAVVRATRHSVPRKVGGACRRHSRAPARSHGTRVIDLAPVRSAERARMSNARASGGSILKAFDDRCGVQIC